MTRVPLLALLVAMHLALSSDAPAQEPVPTARVHVKLLFPPSGDDLGTARVTLFESECNGQDYAKQFRDNSASSIPYCTYRLRAYQDGFWSVEREVAVYQRDVWVVLGLQIGGIDYDQNRFELSGTVRNIPATGQPIWIRLTGVHSTLVMDAKVDDTGSFSIAGIPQDKCVLIVWSGTQILALRPVTIPTDKPLVINVSDRKESY